MSRLVDACLDLASTLTAAGIPASVERAKVRTPGAWISPQTRDITTLDGSGSAAVDVILVVGDHGELTSLKALDEMADKVVALGLALTEPVDTAYALTLTSSPLPAFRVPVELDL
jgi:hypothetical protein